MNSALRLALIATIAATAFTAWKESQQAAPEAMPDAPPVTAARAQPTPPNSADAIELHAATGLSPAKPVDLFSARRWLKALEPAAPAVCKPAKNKPCPKPPEPKAPPLPFALSGVWVEGAIRYVVLSAHGEQVLLCNQCNTPGASRTGATVFGQYRLESLDANQAVFTYLPLMQRQSLMLESL